MSQKLPHWYGFENITDLMEKVMEGSHNNTQTLYTDFDGKITQNNPSLDGKILISPPLTSLSVSTTQALDNFLESMKSRQAAGETPERVLIPLHLPVNSEGLRSEHWAGLVIIPDKNIPEKADAYYINSFGMGSYPEDRLILPIISKHYPSNQGTFRSVTRKFQNDGHNCGPIVVTALSELAKSDNPPAFFESLGNTLGGNNAEKTRQYHQSLMDGGPIRPLDEVLTDTVIEKSADMKFSKKTVADKTPVANGTEAQTNANETPPETDANKSTPFMGKKSVTIGGVILGALAGLGLMATSAKAPSEEEQKQTDQPKKVKINWKKLLLGTALIGVTAYAGYRHFKHGESFADMIKFQRENKDPTTRLPG